MLTELFHLRINSEKVVTIKNLIELINKNN